ncbi:PPE domain-containing protein [Mycobacterium sp. AZCC_0083]|uniref:PPE domain-containing protein n=1 Tax=Mycobacterium sp. AZCC_0083 TaxID=2735882 RepID=UPI00160DFB28|nr:PPE domain-containing protein [Mycobacterium sp. AZCC_0083]MBB5167582.1 hypothetical protein [Mycobacterium sp. AZCC_0083]
MSFTNVAWESRSTEQLAGDLTDGPGPMSVGQAGAAWVRMANELASVSEEYDKVVDRIKSAFASQGADAAVRKLDEFGRWLQNVSLNAVGNGQRAEEVAVAYSVAVLAMPSVSEAIEARAAHDVMASLAAYNGAILHGQFAEFDEAATADQANAAAVMYQYEQACDGVALPWDQPPPPEVSNGAALAAERTAITAKQEAAAGGGHDRGGAVGMPPAPLAPFRAREVSSSRASKQLQTAGSAGGGSAAAGAGPTGSGYGPMAALGRAGASREHQSSMQPATLDGGGEPGAYPSPSGGSWLPAAGPGDAPFVVSDVSWGPSTSVFDDLVGPDQPEAAPYAEDPERTLQQVSDRWVSPPVIGADKGLTL